MAPSKTSGGNVYGHCHQKEEIPLDAMIGRRIRAQRTQLGMTQEELAEQADLSATYISHIEREKKRGSLAALLRIASALGIAPSVLFGGEASSNTNVPHELNILLNDCPPWEQQLLCDVAAALKQSLRRNSPS